MRALIVLGGDAPTNELLAEQAESADWICAADRGLEAFADSAVLPDLVVGDMDSVDPEVLARFRDRIPVEALNCVKDDSDGEHSLECALKKGATEIVFLGALGGRLDHALANLMLLIRAAEKGADASILDERVRIRRVNGQCTLHHAKGDTVSLLPLGNACGITLRGFYYPLENGVMRNDSSLGISNVVTEEIACVKVEQGDLLMFHYYK